MQSELKADLSTMPIANMALFFGGIAVLFILFAVIIVVVVKKLGIKSIGPIHVEQRGQSTMFNMNEAIKDADDICRRQMRQITSNMKIYISNIFTTLKICTIARVAISSAIRFPLYESVSNNHFTTELMPSNYDAYRERLIEMMRDEYSALSSVSKDIQCNRDEFPSWEQISKQLVGCIDLWLKRISREIVLICEKKKAIYEKYLPDFMAVKDDYRIDIVKKCIDKNERYITVLKSRNGKEVL